MLQVSLPLREHRGNPVYPSPLLPPGHPIPLSPPLTSVTGVVRRHIVLLVAMGLLGAGIALSAGIFFQSFVARALIIVAATPGTPGHQDPSGDEQMVIETHVTSLLSPSALRALSASFQPPQAGAGTELSVSNLEKHLKVQQEMHSRVVSISFSAHDAAVAALVANKAASLYVNGEEARDLTALDREVVRRTERLAAAEAEIKALPIGGPADAVLSAQRHHNEAEALLKDTERAQNARRRDGPQGVGVSILSMATAPARPSTGDPVLLALPGFVAFAILGCFLALAIERCDRTLRSERDVETYVGVPCAGLVPRCSRARSAPAIAGLIETSRSPFASSIIALAYDQGLAASGGTRSLLVTAALPGEGLDQIAVALATVSASLGQRTILMDLVTGRRRRGSAQAEPGACDLALGLVPSESTIKTEGAFDRIGPGVINAHAIMSLAGPRLASLLNELGRSYDRIIIVAPPLLSGPESAALSEVADRVLVVLRWGRTRRNFAAAAVALALMARDDRPTERITGVLAGVHLRRHARYRFGDRTEALYRYGRTT